MVHEAEETALSMRGISCAADGQSSLSGMSTIKRNGVTAYIPGLVEKLGFLPLN